MATNLKATGRPLIPRDQAVPLQTTAPAYIRNWKTLPGAESLARDVERIAKGVDSLSSTLSKNAPSIDKIHLTNRQGELVTAIGDFLYQGKQYTNYLNEIHVGDPLQNHDPAHALFNANVDGSVVIGQNGWLDVLDPFGKDAAWIGTQNDTLPVINAFDNGAGLIRLEVTNHTLNTGDTVRVQNVGGVFEPPLPGGTPSNNATGTFVVTNAGANYIDLQESVFAGAYTSGGVVDRVLRPLSVVNNGGLIRILTSIDHLYESGDRVNVSALPGITNGTGQWTISMIPEVVNVTGAVDNGSGLIRLEVLAHNLVTGESVVVANVGGVPNATGTWIVTRIDASHVDLQGSTFAGLYTTGGTATNNHARDFDLVGSVFAGAYTGAGRVLRYFAGMLAQTVAVGTSFQDYKLRAFADGSLRIKNALIDLLSAAGEITLDPTMPWFVAKAFTAGVTTAEITISAVVPSILLNSLAHAAYILLDASVPSMTVEKPTVGKVVIDGSVPNVTLYDGANNVKIRLDPNAAQAIQTSTLTVDGLATLTGGLTANALVSAMAGINVTGDTDTSGDYKKGGIVMKFADGVSGSVTVVVGPLLTDTKTLTFTASGCLASIT